MTFGSKSLKSGVSFTLISLLRPAPFLLLLVICASRHGFGPCSSWVPLNWEGGTQTSVTLLHLANGLEIAGPNRISRFVQFPCSVLGFTAFGGFQTLRELLLVSLFLTRALRRLPPLTPMSVGSSPWAGTHRDRASAAAPSSRQPLCFLLGEWGCSFWWLGALLKN